MKNKEDLINKANQHTVNFHSKIMDTSDDEHAMVTNKSAEGHYKRMEVMMRLGNLEGKTILDVGCGLGHLYEFLKSKNIHVDYYGVDLNPRMIERAQQKYPEIADRFSVRDIVLETLDRKFDYVIMLGLINLDFGDNTNMVMMEKLFRQAHKYANIGYGISMCSLLSRKPSPESFYYNPADITTIIMQECNNFRLDHSYMPHEFTAFCYINDFYSNPK